MRGTLVFFTWALAAAALLACAGCGDGAGDSSGGGQVKRIILISNSESPFWTAVRAGVNKANQELKLSEKGFRAVMQTSQETAEAQIAMLRQLNTQSDVAGVAISCVESSSVPLIDELRKLTAKGIPVVTVDSDVNRDKFRHARIAFVGTDNFTGGVQLGLAARALLPQGGGMVTFVGVPSSQNAGERIGGVIAGAGKRFTHLDTMADQVDQVKMRDNVRNAITNHAEKLHALVGIWSQNAPAIVDVVVKEKDARERYRILSYDAEPATIQAMAEGNVDVMVAQNPFRMGYDSIRLLLAEITGDEATKKEMLPNLGQPDGDIFNTGLKVIVPDGDSPLAEEMFPDAEFFRLKDFRAWLEEYNLKGS